MSGVDERVIRRYDFTRTLAVLKTGAFRHKGLKCFDSLKVNKKDCFKVCPKLSRQAFTPHPRCPNRGGTFNEGICLVLHLLVVVLSHLLLCVL